MMDAREREQALMQMREASRQFYAAAARIGNHPFIEFTGLLNEYIKACEAAHQRGIDFSECNTHSQQPLPLAPFQIDYLSEKLDCIFTGRIRAVHETDESTFKAAAQPAARRLKSLGQGAALDSA